MVVGSMWCRAIIQCGRPTEPSINKPKPNNEKLRLNRVEDSRCHHIMCENSHHMPHESCTCLDVRKKEPRFQRVSYFSIDQIDFFQIIFNSLWTHNHHHQQTMANTVVKIAMRSGVPTIVKFNNWIILRVLDKKSTWRNHENTEKIKCLQFQLIIFCAGRMEERGQARDITMH